MSWLYFGVDKDEKGWDGFSENGWDGFNP